MECSSLPYSLIGTLAAGKTSPAIDVRTPDRLGREAERGYVQNTGFNPLVVSFFGLDNKEFSLELLPGEKESTDTWRYSAVQFRASSLGGSSFRLVAK